MILTPDEPFCFSPLVMMECLVKPYRVADVPLEQVYRTLFAEMDRVEITAEVFDRAARLRAATRLKAMDALHLAAAMEAGCSALWTADAEFAKRSGGFAVDILAGS